VTNRFLHSQTSGEEEDLAVNTKSDIRYHELTSEGDHRRLETTGVTRAILTAEEIEDATQQPPRDTPATLRSQYLKAFAPGNHVQGVNWNTITVGPSWDPKQIDLNSSGQK
jgi:hypothetical protein